METELIRDQAKLPDGTDLQNGRYTIRVALGNGGFGITYKAWDNRLRRYVAVKEFFPAGIVYRDIYNGRDAQCFRIRGSSSGASVASAAKRRRLQIWIFHTLLRSTTASRRTIPHTSSWSISRA